MTDRAIKQPGPAHPITVEPADGPVRVTRFGRTVAASDRALRLQEANYPAVLYLPRDDVDMDQLVRSDHATYCPYKGECAYFSFADGGKDAADAVWSYEAPFEWMAAIGCYLAFYPDRVEITAGG